MAGFGCCSNAHTVNVTTIQRTFMIVPVCSMQTAGVVAAQVWNHLVVKAANKPVSGNMGGSYLTFFSSNGLTFGIINIIGNFGTVFCDQAYWVCCIPLPLQLPRNVLRPSFTCWCCR